MKRERVSEYARMLLGPVRFSDKETRAQAIHTLNAMLNEEFNALRREERHPKVDESKDSYKINGSHTFNAVTLAKAGYLSGWKKKLAEKLGL